MYRPIRLLVGFFGLLMIFTLAAIPGAVGAQNRLCFSEVPDCIEGRFAEYWQQNGGLPIFGFPIGPARLEKVGQGQYLVQAFERNRFELHPENARPYDVLLGRLGDDRLRQLGRPWQAEPKAPSTSQPGCTYFSETGHLVCDAFLRYWSSNGIDLDRRSGLSAAESLALFGLPLTEATVEQSSDGKTYLTQWFERARFELHPEISSTTVLLGLLGRETLQPPPAPPMPTPPSPPATEVPPSESASVSPTSGPGGTVFRAQGFGFTPGEKIGIYVTAPDQSVVGAPFQVQADRSGNSGQISLSTQPNFPTGIWAFTFEGVESGHRAIAYFRLTERAGGPPAGSPPAGGDTSVPDPQNAQVEPRSGRIGTVFVAQGFGFQPGEPIGVYLTAPDQSVVGAPFQVQADGAGNSESVVLRTQAGFPVGLYALTFEGVSSGHRAIAYFRILP